jgi:arylformamidase
LFVFIHGGYWQRNEKERFSFIAPGPRSRGINVAVPGYTLAPQASLTETVAEIRQALTFLADRADELMFDPNNIYIGGWSAGGHLAALVADHRPCAARYLSVAFSTSNRSLSVSLTISSG